MSDRDELTTTVRTYYAPSNVVQQAIGDDVILLDLDSGTYFTLAATGAEIWRRLCTGLNTEEIASAVVAEYDVDKAIAEADLTMIVRELSAAGLIREA